MLNKIMTLVTVVALAVLLVPSRVGGARPMSASPASARVGSITPAALSRPVPAASTPAAARLPTGPPPYPTAPGTAAR